VIDLLSVSHQVNMTIRIAAVMIALACVMLTACSWQPETDPPSSIVYNKDAVPSMIAQADQFYARRDDLTQLEQGIVLLRQATTADPSNYEAFWRLAKFDYYLSSHTDGDYQKRVFREGVDAGKSAIALQPDKPDGHFWLGANYGGSLETETISGLASIGDLRKEMNTVLSIDERYQDGSAYMVLGLLDLKAPRIAGGDPQRAVREMEKGLQFGSGNAFLRLHLAEAYQAVGRSEDARQQLNAILSMTPDPNYLPELKEAQAKARSMMNENKSADTGEGKSN